MASTSFWHWGALAGGWTRTENGDGPRTHGDGDHKQWQEVAIVWTRVGVPVIRGTARLRPMARACSLALGRYSAIAAPDTEMGRDEIEMGASCRILGGMVVAAQTGAWRCVATVDLYRTNPSGAEQGPENAGG